MVDQQSGDDRNIFVLEQPDALQYAVFINLKIALMQIGDMLALPVAHRNGQHHQVDVHRNQVRSRVLAAARRLSLKLGIAPGNNQE